MNKKVYKILILEDVATDAELVEYELKKGNFQFVSKIVSTKDSFVNALSDFVPDLVLSDYKLPGFDGLSALEITKEKCPETPFIFVTGAMGDQFAVETLKKGAVDYVLKDKLSQLLPAIYRVFRSIVISEKAKEVEQYKTEFIVLASHQLRTPLTAIRWFAEFLLGNKAGKLSSKQKEFVDIIYESTKRMINLTDSLFTVSSFESGLITIHPKLTQLETIVDKTILELTFLIKNKGAVVNFTKPQKPLPFIQLDGDLIQQVILMLIKNSLEYGPATKSQVEIVLTTTGLSVAAAKKVAEKFQISQKILTPMVLVSIADNGIGIPEDFHGRIFEKFFRAENAVKASPDGSGLGLFFAKFIIESSGGKIWFDSIEGKGTTFYFTVPLK